MIPGLPAEEVGQTAANMLLSNLQYGGCVDEYLQDQVGTRVIVQTIQRSNAGLLFHISFDTF